ncbi:hypothetical protein Vadar_026577 [Vaccinium darrowii]|uniref:Uncharacterized protein n=1 Tax=Vaccinium darrowii TaxID=229202 RepID=A0ACB7ZN45_9ERIC|nr:hypothetical protein Vadar_026577 [Vaccinium darrowii]
MKYQIVNIPIITLIEELNTGYSDILHPGSDVGMTFCLFYSILQRLASRWPLLQYAATWTAILTITAAVASFSPEWAFISAISPTSAFSRPCEAKGFIRVPIDVPTEVLCFPAHMVGRSKLDMVVAPIFAAVVVAGSAYVVRALGLWEVDDEA